jgi:hypothetical protein
MLSDPPAHKLGVAAGYPSASVGAAMPQWLVIVLASGFVLCYGGLIWARRRRTIQPPHAIPWISTSDVVLVCLLLIAVALAESYPLWSVPLILLITGFVGITRHVTKFRRAPSAEDFRELFLGGWVAAGPMVIGAILILQQLLLEPSTLVLLVIMVGLPIYFAVGYFAIWVGTRRYRRALLHPDFAEDESGNPIRGAAPEPPDEEVIETWEDLVRAQRRRRGVA